MHLRLAAAILVPALALAVPMAGHATHSEDPLIASGTILVGHPVSSISGGVTENLAPCTPADPINGVDGVWVDLLDFQGHDASMVVDATLDADVFFYTAACDYVAGADLNAGFLGEPEAGTVPADAQYAVVNGFLGTGSFTLTVG
jgi:hypothetical protein